MVGRPYLEIHIDREAIARYGIHLGRVQTYLDQTFKRSKPDMVPVPYEAVAEWRLARSRREQPSVDLVPQES